MFDFTPSFWLFADRHSATLIGVAISPSCDLGGPVGDSSPQLPSRFDGCSPTRSYRSLCEANGRSGSLLLALHDAALDVVGLRRRWDCPPSSRARITHSACCFRHSARFCDGLVPTATSGRYCFIKWFYTALGADYYLEHRKQVHFSCFLLSTSRSEIGTSRVSYVCNSPTWCYGVACFCFLRRGRRPTGSDELNEAVWHSGAPARLS